jgi:hypothetical protein
MPDIEDVLTAVIDAQRLLDGTVPVSAAEILGAAAFLGPFPAGGDWRDSPLLRSWAAGGGT